MFLRTLLSAFTLLLLISFSFVNLSVRAATFESGQGQNSIVNINDSSKNYENLYATGATVNINTKIGKDLIMSGSNLNLQSDVERSLMAAGANLNFQNATIGASSRLAGANINLSNVTIEEDLLVAGANITLNNVIIKGDLVVAAASFDMISSRVEGDFYGSIDSDRPEFRNQVAGTYNLDDSSTRREKSDEELRSQRDAAGRLALGAGAYFKLISEVSALVVLTVFLFILASFGKIADKNIRFTGTELVAHFGIGLGAYFLIPILLLVSVITALILAPVTMTLVGLIILLGFLISPITNWYISNLLANGFNYRVKWWHSYIVYLIFLFVGFVPILNILSALIMSVLGLANFGYWILKTTSASLENLKRTND